MTREPADRDAPLRTFCWARLAAAGFLVGVGPWGSGLVPTSGPTLLLAVVALLVASSTVLLVPKRTPRPAIVARLLCVLDAALVTGVVAATGAGRSILVCLYVVLVVGACLVLSRWGALVVALVSSGLYTTLLMARHIVPALAFDEPVDRLAALDMLTTLVTSGTVILVSVVAGGLSERYRLSQHELARERRSRGDLQAFSDVIFESVGTGLVAVDRAHRITAFNRAAETLTGVPAAVAVGAGWADVFGEGPALEDIETAGSPGLGASRHRELDLRRGDGTMLPLRITTWTLQAGDGTRLGCIAACEDLSSIRAMEASMRQADRLAALGRLAANIAHEVRNPLASLSGAVEALTGAAVSADTRTRLTEIVVRESRHLSAMIGDFLEYARPAPLVLERIEAAVVLDDVLNTLPPRLCAEGVKIVRAFPPSLTLDADRARFRQVVWTVCGIALSAMPAGGELRVDACRVGGMAEITVTDTGAGISAEDLPHAFEPFFATRRDATGLGLALVHRIVHEHGGEVALRSDGGAGAEFTLRFPARHA